MVCKEVTVVACKKGTEIVYVHGPEVLIVTVVLIHLLETAGVCVH